MLKITVVPNCNIEFAKHCAENILKILLPLDCKAVLVNDAFSDGSEVDTERLKKIETDIFIAVGGDGTIIHLAKLAAEKDVPVLGVNAGRLGFTAGVEHNEIEKIKNLLQGKYETEKRRMVEIKLLSGAVKKTFFALNDAVVSSGLSKIMDYSMAIGAGNQYLYRADGFIVSTPTGSTAYSLSAGGPVMDPTMDAMLFTPICPHSLLNRSIVFDKNTDLVVKFPESMLSAQLTVDGEPPKNIVHGDSLSFSMAKKHVEFIKLDRSNFYDILNKKILIGRN